MLCAEAFMSSAEAFMLCAEALAVCREVLNVRYLNKITELAFVLHGKVKSRLCLQVFGSDIFSFEVIESFY